VDVSRAFRERKGEREIYVAKETWFKLSDQSSDGAQYVNAIYPLDPYGPGRNLDLLGDLVYAKDAVLTVVRPDSAVSGGSLQRAIREDSARSETPQQGSSTRTADRRTGIAAPHRVTRDSPPSEEGRSTERTEDPFAGVPSVRLRQRL
jgi:hypothetical protein